MAVRCCEDILDESFFGSIAWKPIEAYLVWYNIAVVFLGRFSSLNGKGARLQRARQSLG